MELSQYFQKDGLIPAIVQDSDSGEVLMLAYMNEESLKKTLETGYTWFFSRSRGNESGSLNCSSPTGYPASAQSVAVFRQACMFSRYSAPGVRVAGRAEAKGTESSASGMFARVFWPEATGMEGNAPTVPLPIATPSSVKVHL